MHNEMQDRQTGILLEMSQNRKRGPKMKSHRIQIFASMLLSGMLLCAGSMRADTVFSSFGPGQSFPTNHFWDVGNTGSGSGQVVAFPFIPSETVELTSADLALSQQISPFTPLNVFIETNTSGMPGSILDTLTQQGTFNANAAVVSFTCSTCSVLTAGTTYWIVGQQSDASAQTVWLWSPTDTASWFFNSTDSATGPWSPATVANNISAFDVNGTTPTSPTPEPGSLALLATGVLGLMAAGRRRIS